MGRIRFLPSLQGFSHLMKRMVDRIKVLGREKSRFFQVIEKSLEYVSPDAVLISSRRVIP